MRAARWSMIETYTLSRRFSSWLSPQGTGVVSCWTTLNGMNRPETAQPCTFSAVSSSPASPSSLDSWNKDREPAVSIKIHSRQPLSPSHRAESVSSKPHLIRYLLPRSLPSPSGPLMSGATRQPVTAPSRSAIFCDGSSGPMTPGVRLPKDSRGVLIKGASCTKKETGNCVASSGSDTSQGSRTSVVVTEVSAEREIWCG
ncbi:hypothetical protein VTI74DRAFT_3331 [Chaetomium olivicolor]